MPLPAGALPRVVVVLSFSVLLRARGAAQRRPAHRYGGLWRWRSRGSPDRVPVSLPAVGGLFRREQLGRDPGAAVHPPARRGGAWPECAVSLRVSLLGKGKRSCPLK